MFKLAIFDLDGTLLNTLGDIAEATNFALRQQGFPMHEVERYKDFLGRGPDYLIRSALPEQARDDATVSDTKRTFSAYYAKHSEDLTKPYDGIIDALRDIKRAGVHIAVFSNKPHDATVYLCGEYFPGLIDMPCGLREGAKTKPDATVGLAIMERFGVSADETIYIGDSGIDMQTGRNLGVYKVGVSWGFRPKNELVSEGADVIIDKAEQLIKIVIDK